MAMTDQEVSDRLALAAKRVGPQQVAEEPIAAYFAFGHLPERLQAVSSPFARLAAEMLALPPCDERAAGMRKLLEAKDCAVRAALSKAG